MAEDWSWVKGFNGYLGGPNVVATSSTLPFSPSSPTATSEPPSSFHSLQTRQQTLTTPPPDSGEGGFHQGGREEGGRHSFLPPVAPSRSSTSSYIALSPPEGAGRGSVIREGGLGGHGGVQGGGQGLGGGGGGDCGRGRGEEERDHQEQEASSSSGSWRQSTKRREKADKREEMEVKLRLGKDEKRAREAGIGLNVKQEIIGLPMDEFNDLIGKQGYSEDQLNMCRDIRKRGKNKMAAQNCRKRKLCQIDELAERLERARKVQDQMRSGHKKLLLEYSSEAGKLQELTDRVLHFHHKNPEHWLVQVIGEEVEIVHKSTVPEQERFPPPAEKYLGHQGREWQGQGCV